MKCRKCKGSGMITTDPNVCPDCHGSGNTCRDCGQPMSGTPESAFCEECRPFGTCGECGVKCHPNDTICNGCYEAMMEDQLCID